MSEQSERMMLLLKELAVLKEWDAGGAAAPANGELSSAAARRRRRQEIARQIKQIAQEKKGTASK
jgi:hypothetical protein